MSELIAKSCDNGDKNGRQDCHGGDVVHEAADEQQEAQQHQHDDVLVAGQAQQEGGELGGDLHRGQQVAEAGGARDGEQAGAGGQRRIFRAVLAVNDEIMEDFRRGETEKIQRYHKKEICGKSKNGGIKIAGRISFTGNKNTERCGKRIYGANEDVL